MKIIFCLISFMSISAVSLTQKPNEILTNDQITALRKKTVQARYDGDLQAQLQIQKDPRNALTLDGLLQEAQAGDILFLRSGNFVGSLTARSSDIPGHFAHVAVVVEDPVSHELKAIESTVGVGVHFLSIKEAIDGRTRVAIFRNQDPLLGNMVAKNLFTFIEGRLRSGRIPYDNMINNMDHSALTCTEVVSFAYSLFGIRDIPMFPSHFLMFTPEIKMQMGLKTTDFFTPQDLEIDPRFRLVKEWRDLSTIQKVYRADAVFAKFFAWLKNGSLKLERDTLSSLLVPFFSRQFAEKLGYPESAEQEASNMIRYSVNIYTYLQLMENQLTYALYGQDVTNFKVADYDAILESIGPNGLYKDPREL